MNFLYAMLHPCVKWLRTSPFIIQFFWKVRVPPGAIIHWDTVTLLMRKPLKKYQKSCKKILEMGIGQGALNTLFLAQLSGIRVHGVDISVERVNHSRTTAKFNNLNVDFWISDLFGGVKEEYDLIFFNPPYVPTAKGKKLALTKKLNLNSDQVWDGGIDGMRLIKKFLGTAKIHMETEGRLLIGVQDIYISKAQMLTEIERYHYTFTQIHKEFIIDLLVPTSIYEIRVG